MPEIIIAELVKKETNTVDGVKRKLRVGAYARVSTKHKAQLQSFYAQIREYTEQIKANVEWEFVEVYADRDTGRNTKKRDNFLRMIEDAEKGNLDLLLTKEVSRFARNLEDSIYYTRHLRDLGVTVYFEVEGIYSSNREMDTVFLVLANQAQATSERIGRSIRWGIRQAMKNGNPHINCDRFLGYDKVFDDEKRAKLIVNEPQAETVRMIYDMYLSGMGFEKIAREMERLGRTTGTGNTKWTHSSVGPILKNRTYTGELLLQKTVTIDTMTEKRVKNDNTIEGFTEILIKKSHEAIIPLETFERVQKLIAEKFKISCGQDCDRTKYNRTYAMSGKLLCGHCGKNLTRRHWQTAKGQPKRQVWKCTHIVEGHHVCKCRAVEEETLHKSFVDVFNSIIGNKKAFFDNFFTAIEKRVAKGEKKGEYESLQKELEKQNESLDGLTLQFVGKEIDSERYYRLKSKTTDAIAKLQEQIDLIIDTQASEDDRKYQMEKARKLMNSYENPISEFDDTIFREFVEKVVVFSPVEFRFHLRNGLTIPFDATKHHQGRPVRATA